MSSKESNDDREESSTWPDLDLDRIRSRQAEYYKRHESLLQKLDGIVDEYLRLFLELSCFAFVFIKDKIDEEFMLTYMILSSRWFSHFESLACLLKSGYYRDVMALARMLTGDINLMLYFSHFPEDVPKWRKLADYGPKKKNEPKSVKTLRQYFLDSEVRKRLATKELPFEEAGVLSEAIHATEWGTQFYSRKEYDAEHTHRIHFGPQYDPIRAMIMWHFLIAYIQPPIDAFLRHCRQIGLDIPDNKKIEAKYRKLAEEYQQKMNRFQFIANMIEGIEARVESGEDFNKIVDEKLKEFREAGYLDSKS